VKNCPTTVLVRSGGEVGVAPQDRRAHQALAEIGLGDDERAPLTRRYQQRLAGSVGASIDPRRLSRERPDFAMN